MTHSEKLSLLRDSMQGAKIDAYIIALADPHISEYLPDRYKNIEWLSGFTGSAGTLAITADFAGLWTDSRYFVQAADQLQGTGFELVKLNVQGSPEYATWLTEHLPAGATVAFDGKLLSIAVAQQLIESLGRQSVTVKTDVDLIGPIWTDRPGLPQEKAFLISEAFSGKTTAEKIKQVRATMRQKGADFHLVSSLDDIAWIFNIRGGDVKCNPVVLSFALFSPDRAELFIDRQKLNDQDLAHLEASGVSIRNYDDIAAALERIPAGKHVLIDPRRNCFTYFDRIPKECVKVQEINPSTQFKAIKNDIELQHTRVTMAKDGAALTRFFRWLEESVGKQEITEMGLAENLRNFRAGQEGFVGESFDTIGGYREHGALPHYKAIPESDSVLEKRGLLLVDSGGQYDTGTTDITRVVSLGEATEQEKTDYTLVLKSMIEGSMCSFPAGTRGYQIDAITRKPLWDYQRNYGHGTGHGVGFFLNVHEGPHVFNSAPVDIAIEPGMVTSIEPGLYREGEYGIRIENLVASHLTDQTFFGQFMEFETLTLCYIDTDLIDKTLLDQRHIDWLNAYHQKVYEQVSPLLNADEQQWLASKTLAI
jgi:Xaa-Pro aminopeptidase